MQGKLVKLKNEINLLARNKITASGSIGIVLEMKSKDNMTVLIDGEVLSMEKKNFLLMDSGSMNYERK